MNREQLVARAKAILSEAYDEAAELVALYVERTGEPLQSLCKEIDPENWNALRNRVQRAQESIKAAGEAGRKRAAAQDIASDRAKAKRVLRMADHEQVEEIVAALPTEAVERVMHAATSDLGRRQRPVRESKPVGKTLFQRFADHCFTGWKLQDELQDTPPPTGDELIRFQHVARANLAFAQMIVRWLETGDFDAEVAEFLEQARESA